MLDAYNTVVLDPIIEQVARELGICSQTEQEKPYEQSNPKDI